MNLKRMALKGVVILVVVIALCMFFSQTVLTITTPKVKLVSAKRGKLEQKIKLTGELWYPASEAYTLDEAKDLPAIVDKTYVRVGDEVKKGDLLFTTRLLPACDEAVQKAKDELKKAEDALTKTETSNAKAKVKDTVKNKAERALQRAREATTVAQQALIDLAAQKGFALSDNPSDWSVEQFESAPQDIKALFDAIQPLKDAEKAATNALRSSFTKNEDKNNNYELVKKREDHALEINKCKSALFKLTKCMETLKAVRAPRDGVIAKFDVQAGEQLPGDKAAYTLASEAPVLRADLAEVRKEVTKDMKVDVKGDDEWTNFKTTVTDIKRESATKKYAIIEITDEMLSGLGGYRSLSEKKLDMTISYHARSAAYILPASAVRGEDGSNYVLVVEDSSSFWGQEKRVRKMDVHVVDRADTQVAVEEELNYVSIADGEDRPIQDKSRVMEYLT